MSAISSSGKRVKQMNTQASSRPVPPGESRKKRRTAPVPFKNRILNFKVQMNPLLPKKELICKNL